MAEVDASQSEALLTAMVLMTLADGEVAQEELTRIRWVYSKLLDAEIAEEGVRAAIARVGAENLSIESHLAAIGDELGEDGRRRLLKAAFAIASADGRVVDEEDELLVRIAKALRISPESYRALLSHMMVAREFG